jgi:hypothetical protein
MTQALYAHMNNKIKIKKKNPSKTGCEIYLYKAQMTKFEEC